MKNAYMQKLFEFTNIFIDNPVNFGYVELYQIGETCLESGAYVPEHIQTCHEISFVVSGCGKFGTDNYDEKLKVGDIHVISEGCTHKIRADENFELRYVHFAFKFTEKAKEAGLSDVAEFYNNSPHTIVRDNGEVRTLFSMLIDEFFINPEHSAVIVDSIIKQVLIYVWRMFSLKHKAHFIPAKSKDIIGGTVYGVIRYIDSHICDVLSVKDIAEKFSYSSNYISHLVKSKTGMSLQKYIQNERTQYAKKLLCDKKSTITEVSRILNYDSPQAFSKMFRKQTGMLPSEYREQIEE